MLSWIEHHNPFPIFALLFLSVLAGYYYSNRFGLKPGRCRTFFLSLKQRHVAALWVLFLVAFAGALAFEVYFRYYQCRVSQHYYDENIRLLHSVAATLNIAGIPYWVDYASLLNVIRKEDINPWDHDVDLSVEHVALREDGTVDEAGIKNFQSMLSAGGLTSIWDPDRELMQVYPGGRRRGPHVDLWLWRRGKDAQGQDVLSTADDVHYNPRLRSEIFPLKPAKWLGIDVTIPRDPHRVSSLEFARFSGSYMVAAYFRRDCFHNLFQGRWGY